MPFANQILGGDDSLVRAMIKSPDFNLAAQTGWAIFKDGSAYFFNVTATGAVTAKSVIVDGPTGGVFIYDGLPGPGKLVVAITGAAGVDQYGNGYSGPGICVNEPGTNNRQIQVRPDLNAILIYATT